MNKNIGMIASIVTFAGVAGFAVSMLTGNLFGSYLTSMLIAWGFVTLICSFAAFNAGGTHAAGYTAVAFAAVYAAIIVLVYFAQLTTVRQAALSEEAAQLLDYQKFGLFFNYDLLGYSFMALSTFFIGLTVRAENKADRWLKALLLVHGIFAVTCVAMPIIGVFGANTPDGDKTGIWVLLFWCAYFIPICILSWRHFKLKA